MWLPVFQGLWVKPRLYRTGLPKPGKPPEPFLIPSSLVDPEFVSEGRDGGEKAVWRMGGVGRGTHRLRLEIVNQTSKAAICLYEAA